MEGKEVPEPRALTELPAHTSSDLPAGGMHGPCEDTRPCPTRSAEEPFLLSTSQFQTVRYVLSGTELGCVLCSGTRLSPGCWAPLLRCTEEKEDMDRPSVCELHVLTAQDGASITRQSLVFTSEAWFYKENPPNSRVCLFLKMCTDSSRFTRPSPRKDSASDAARPSRCFCRRAEQFGNSILMTLSAPTSPTSSTVTKQFPLRTFHLG